MLRPLPTLTFRRRLLFCLLPTLMFLSVGELVARVWLYGFASPDNYPKYALATEFPTAAKYVPHHYLCYTLQPGYCKGATSHNSLGFRGPEVAIPKPRGTFRIVTLGGSTTYGEFIADNADAYPAQLERSLRDQYGHSSVEVINAGCPGYNSWENLLNLQFRVLDLQPDLVIVYPCVNDAHARLVLPAAYRADNSGRRTIWTPPIEVRLMRYSLLGRIVGHHLGLWNHPGVDSFVQADTSDPGLHGPSSHIGGDPIAALAANPPIYLRRNLRNMIAIAHANDTRIMLATWAYSPHRGDYAATPHYQQAFAENNDIVRQVATAEGALLYDFAPHMPQSPDYWRDGRHVNEKGARLQGEKFAKFISDSGVIDKIAAWGRLSSLPFEVD